MHKHTAFMWLSVSDFTSSREHNFSPLDKQILRALYGDLHKELSEIRTLHSTDPTSALHRLNSLLTRLHNQLH